MVEYKIVTPRSKHIYISVCLLRDQFDNGVFVTKYDNYSVISADMFTKTCLGLTISRGNTWVAYFHFYLSSDTENYQLMKLHESDLN